MAAHGSVGRFVTAGAVGRRPTNGCTERRASTLFRSFERRRAAPVNLRIESMKRLFVLGLFVFAELGHSMEFGPLASADVEFSGRYVR